MGKGGELNRQHPFARNGILKSEDSAPECANMKSKHIGLSSTLSYAIDFFIAAITAQGKVGDLFFLLSLPNLYATYLLKSLQRFSTTHSENRSCIITSMKKAVHDNIPKEHHKDGRI